MRIIVWPGIVAVCIVVVAGCSSEVSDSATPGAEAPATDMKPTAQAPAETVHEPLPGAEAEPEPSADAADATAMDLYRRAQAHMQVGRKQEGYETARAAMQRFIAEGNDLAWIILESVDVGDKRIDVHFNMGPKERDATLDGIVKPLSFRVWSTGEDSTLLRTLDYENGRFNGQVLTAAIGEQRGTMHGNLGMLEPDASYDEILQKVIEIVEGM